MRTESQLLESTQRFHTSFWKKERADRPLVGVYDERIFLPIDFLRQPFANPTVTPDDVSADRVMTEYEYSFQNRSISCDDYIAFSAPWRGIPWLEACCGCAVRYSEGSLAPSHFVQAPEDLADLPIPAPNTWFDCMRNETERLRSQQAADCWISPSILRGPSDVLAAMRGLKEFYLDLHDNPQALAEAATRVNALLIKSLDMHYETVQPKLGGYGHIFGYWAPGKTIVIQEDVMGMCSPQCVSRHFHAEQCRGRPPPWRTCDVPPSFDRVPALQTCFEHPRYCGTGNSFGIHRPNGTRHGASFQGSLGEVPAYVARWNGISSNCQRFWLSSRRKDFS